MTRHKKLLGYLILVAFAAFCFITTVAHAAPSKGPDECSWNNPGANRYTGTTEDAIMSYSDMPLSVRKILISKVNGKDYDDIVDIKRQSVESKKTLAPLESRSTYSYILWDMHFGSKGKVCKYVDRSKWDEKAVESAMVYCHEDQCIAIPAVCGNVSRIAKFVEEEKNALIGPPLTPRLPTEDSFESLASLPPLAESSPAPMAPEGEPPQTFSQSTVAYFAIPPGISIGGLPGKDVPITAPIPEPSTYALMAFGLLGLFIYRKRKGNQHVEKRRDRSPSIKPNRFGF